jgi:hypothetical protein
MAESNTSDRYECRKDSAYGSQLKHTPDADAPPFHSVRWVALVRRLMPCIQKTGAAFLDGLHALFAGDVSSECLIVPIVYKLVADEMRQLSDQSNTHPQMLDVFRFQGARQQVATDDAFPHGCERLSKEQEEEEKEKEKEKETSTNTSTSKPTLPERTVFCERWERATHGFCQHSAIAALLNEQLIMPCAGMVAHCLESADAPPPGKDVDIFVHLGTHTIAQALDKIASAFDAWTAEQFPGKCTYWAFTSTCCVELAIDDVACTYQFVFCTGAESLAQILFLFDVSHKMVSYDGHTVRAPYDGLQSWLTGRSYYWPRRGDESQIKAARIAKLLASGFDVYIPAEYNLRWHPNKKTFLKTVHDVNLQHSSTALLLRRVHTINTSTQYPWKMPAAKAVLPRSDLPLMTNLALVQLALGLDWTEQVHVSGSDLAASLTSSPKNEQDQPSITPLEIRSFDLDDKIYEANTGRSKRRKWM